MRTATILLAAAVAVATCYAFSRDSVPTFRADADVYAAGATLQLLLRNDTDEVVLTHPSLCGAVLERETDGVWRWSDPYGPFVVCTAMAATLQPGDSIRAARDLAGLPPGTYRFRIEVTLDRSRSRTVLETPFFRIR